MLKFSGIFLHWAEVVKSKHDLEIRKNIWQPFRTHRVGESIPIWARNYGGRVHHEALCYGLVEAEEEVTESKTKNLRANPGGGRCV